MLKGKVTILKHSQYSVLYNFPQKKLLYQNLNYVGKGEYSTLTPPVVFLSYLN